MSSSVPCSVVAAPGEVGEAVADQPIGGVADGLLASELQVAAASRRRPIGHAKPCTFLPAR